MRINTTRLRVLLGCLSMFLPWIVALLVGRIPSSISITWYSNACTVFMIILGSCSILLMSYKGYEPIDDITLSLAGICGIGICLFPMAPDFPAEQVGTFLLDPQISDIIHTTCAMIFFALLSYNSIFLFTKGVVVPTKRKKIRNIIYIVCGVGMLASFTILLLPEFYIQVWLTETIALTFFGLSFLTKANVCPLLFCDEKSQIKIV